MQSNRSKWVKSQMDTYTGINEDVINFIADIRYKSEDGCSINAIVDLFRNGYCYYFAIILQTAFGRGTICYSYDNGHIIWVDDDNASFALRTAYDIEGTYTDYNTNCLIPMDIFEEGIIDFMHTPGLRFSADKKFIKEKASIWLDNEKVRNNYNNYNQLNNIKKFVERWKSAIGVPYCSMEGPAMNLADRYMDDFTETYMKEFPNANRYILQFIEDMIFKVGSGGVPYIVTLFCRGYCYYFAKILKEAFPNGSIWLSIDAGHIVFVDGENPFDSLFYDARGVVTDIDAHELCPIEIFGEHIVNYMHLPYVEWISHIDDLNIAADTWRDNGSKSVSELLREAEGN